MANPHVDLLQIGEHADAQHEPPTTGQRLGDLAVFKGCDPTFLDAIAEQARRYDLEADEEVDLKNDGPLWIVEHGALRLCVGAGPAVTVGPGFALNCTGFLGVLADADAYRPRRESYESRPAFKADGIEEVPPYCLLTNTSAPPPTLFVEKKKMSVPRDKKAQALDGDEICFYNLCPHAAFIGGSSSRRPAGWMTMSIQGAAPGAQPCNSNACHTEKTEELGGARLVIIPGSLVESLGRGPQHTEGYRCYCENSRRLKVQWRIVLSRCAAIFPNVPPHALWAVAEVSELVDVKSGEYIVSENGVGEDAGSLKVIVSGTAIVEKLVGMTPQQVDVRPVGRLSPGAIIGDLCLIGATIPRPASARATTEVHVLSIPMQAMLDLVRHYPGILAGMGSRLRSVAGFIQTMLPLCSEALQSVNLFASCDEAFLRAISGDRRAFFGGHIFGDDDDMAGTVYAVEYGRCDVEVAGRGMLAEIPTGKCFAFGEPSLVGSAEITHKAAVVRVVTPIAILLRIEKKSLAAVFDHFLAEKKRFKRMLTTGGGRICAPEKIDVFGKCGARFIDNIFSSIELKCYMTGQTVVVMGAQDFSQMFMLKSGHVDLEKNGDKLGEMCTGASFGELVMLGVTRLRTITIRASTMCFTMEIPRSTFLSAIEKNPEERPRFEQLAMKNMDLDSAVIWPILRGSPERMLLLLNLHAERRMCSIKDPFLATPAIRQAALLLLQGSASICVNDEQTGEVREVQPLKMGECVNEQILLGVENSRGEFVVPKTVCEVQIVTMQAWQKVCDEFECEMDNVRRYILKHMAERSEFRLGVTPGSTHMLKSSALFRGTSQPFVQAVRDRLKSILCKPGKIIIEAGKDGDGFYLLLDGVAAATLRENTFKLTSGAIFGEAVLIGIVKAFQKSVTATSLCIVQKLRKADFRECLQQHSTDQRYFELPVLEAEKDLHDSLPNRVRNSMTFSSCDPYFLDLVCPHVDDQFFMAREEIFRSGELFVVGASYVYLLLAGQAVVEDELGVTLGIVNVGEVMGEGALTRQQVLVGASDKRTATVRAWNRGLVHCAKIPSQVLLDGFESCPSVKDIFINLSKRRHLRNMELLARRKMWLTEVAVPAIRQSLLFSWCSQELAQSVAAHLAETVFAPGEIIYSAGEEANSMMVLLEGEALIESRCGMIVGSYTDGAIIGEIAVMGIFLTRTATVRAHERCRVIQLAVDVFERSFPGNGGEILKNKLVELADGRHDQVKHGRPLSILPLGIPADDVCVRAVALQADRIDLEPGEYLEPLSDRSPCGAHFAVLARGRACMEMSNGREVMTLTTGNLIIEGIVADYGAQLRAKSSCEVYRVRQSDFMIAVLSVPAAHEWFYRFRLLEHETKQRYHMRMQSARGAPGNGRDRPSSAIASHNARSGPAAQLALTHLPRDMQSPASSARLRPHPASAAQAHASMASTWGPDRSRKLDSGHSQLQKAVLGLELPGCSSARDSDGPQSGTRSWPLSKTNQMRSLQALGPGTQRSASHGKAHPKQQLQRVGSAPAGVRRARNFKSRPCSPVLDFKDASPTNSAHFRSLPVVEQAS